MRLIDVIIASGDGVLRTSTSRYSSRATTSSHRDGWLRREQPRKPGGDLEDPSREVGRGIQSCLLRMKRERRLAVTLYLQGHNVAEAARILDWPVKRTENLIYRGLADLRACLKSKRIEP